MFRFQKEEITEYEYIQNIDRIRTVTNAKQCQFILHLLDYFKEHDIKYYLQEELRIIVFPSQLNKIIPMLDAVEYISYLNDSKHNISWKTWFMTYYKVELLQTSKNTVIQIDQMNFSNIIVEQDDWKMPSNISKRIFAYEDLYFYQQSSKRNYPLDLKGFGMIFGNENDINFGAAILSWYAKDFLIYEDILREWNLGFRIYPPVEFTELYPYRSKKELLEMHYHFKTTRADNKMPLSLSYYIKKISQYFDPKDIVRCYQINYLTLYKEFISGSCHCSEKQRIKKMLNAVLKCTTKHDKYIIEQYIESCMQAKQTIRFFSETSMKKEIFKITCISEIKNIPSNLFNWKSHKKDMFSKEFQQIRTKREFKEIVLKNYFDIFADPYIKKMIKNTECGNLLLFFYHYQSTFYKTNIIAIVKRNPKTQCLRLVAFDYPYFKPKKEYDTIRNSIKSIIKKINKTIKKQQEESL